MQPLEFWASTKKSNFSSIIYIPVKYGAHQIDVEAHGGDAVDDVHRTPNEIHNI